MTPRQRDALNTYLDEIGRRGRVPTWREFAPALGMSPKAHSAGRRLIMGLRRRGFIAGPQSCPTFASACFKAYRFDPDEGPVRVT